MIRKGTTPIQKFTLPFSGEDVSAAKVTYKQGSEIVLEKRLDSFQVDGNQFVVRLSQEDTFKFSNNKPVQIQLRVVTKGGDARATKIYQEQVEQSLDEEVL